MNAFLAKDKLFVSSVAALFIRELKRLDEDIPLNEVAQEATEKELETLRNLLQNWLQTTNWEWEKRN